MPFTHTVGRLTVIALQDAEGPFPDPRQECFPGATAAQWAEADALDPAARGSGGEWWLRFRSYAIRAGDGPVTLVDAGIGPEGSLAADWAPVPGHLPDELAAAGIAPSEVSAIVLTHLHNDHMGWAVPRDSPFTHARVIVQQADFDAYRANRDQAGQYDLLIEPLWAQGRLQVLDGDHDLSPGLRVLSTPGHTPGHQTVLVEDGDDSLLVTGDLLVHAIQLLHPELAYASDVDPERARASRRKALAEAGGRGTTLAISHLGTAFRELPLG
ncbi:MBL fold metallo-hydrolase [Paractinoplanes durhamensis]|uniref:MBL fold metallo-hydrolase n=1 Tax=Paractinoplanes durhamensis TaxID=113563 RepID=A0ABQ3Z2F8_9ACTN|nr:MBL fold metallo-hydrolase [Actinoplanes durhamensis]GIE04017.1 MBL fold metallo-hydrolase [Actinoplanes durhamensis]